MKYSYVIQLTPFGDRTVYTYSSKELNIAYISTTKKCTFSYNLELVDKREAERQITHFSNVCACTTSTVPGHELDLNIMCCFPDTMSDNDILNAINREFVSD